MPINFACPHCGHETTVADTYAGQTGPCSRCGQTITIPGMGGKPPTAPPPRSGGSAWVIGGVVVAIVLLCVVLGGAFSMFGVRAARDAARRTASSNNLHQIGIAMQNHHDQYNFLPARANTDKDNQPLLSWRVHILPFVDWGYLHSQFHFDEPWDSPHNSQFIKQMPMMYRHPAGNSEEGKTRYLAVVGKNAAFAYLLIASDPPAGLPPVTQGRSFSEFSDGLSNTIFVIEVPADQAVIWTKPDDWEYTPQNVDALAKRIAEGERLVAARADASVTGLSKTVDAENLRRLIEIDDGKPVKY